MRTLLVKIKFTTTSVRDLHLGIAQRNLAPAHFDPLLPILPALETITVANAASFSTGAFDWLASQPLLCPSLNTIAFFNCALTPGVMEEFERVIEKRKGLEAAWLYRVVIVSSTGVLPDYTLIQRLRRHVSCVDVRVDDKLPDLS